MSKFLRDCTDANRGKQNRKEQKKIKTTETRSLPETEDRLLVFEGEVTEGLNNPCRVPLMVMDLNRLGEVGRKPNKALPDDATLR